MTTITIKKKYYFAQFQIELGFEPHPEVTAKIQTISTARYSKATKRWYIDYDTQSYQQLKSLGYPIYILQPGTTNDRVHTSIDSTTTESNSVLSQIPKDRDADIPKKRAPVKYMPWSTLLKLFATEAGLPEL